MAPILKCSVLPQTRPNQNCNTFVYRCSGQTGKIGPNRAATIRPRDQENNKPAVKTGNQKVYFTLEKNTSGLGSTKIAAPELEDAYLT